MKKTSRYIFLTQGKIALVDWEDYDMLALHKWCYSRTRKRTQGYACRYVNDGSPKGALAGMHRQIMGLPLLGRDLVVDHVNGDRLDNRKANLRVCTTAQNLVNRPKKGVWKNSGAKAKPWRAGFRCGGVYHYLGTFVTQAEAVTAYNKADEKWRGGFGPAVRAEI